MKNTGITVSPIGRAIAKNRHGVVRYIAQCIRCGAGFAPCYRDDDQCGCIAEMRDNVDRKADEVLSGYLVRRDV